MVSRQYQIDVTRRLRCTLKRFAVSYLTLPAVNDAFHKRAVDLGWIAR
jgi:hypothetical protein